MAIELKDISRGAAIRAPKIILYGTEGIGKTTFASKARNPIFLCHEEGLGKIDVPHFQAGDDGYVLRSYEQTMECLNALYTEDHDYKTLVDDSLTSLEPLIWEKTCRSIGDGRGNPVDSIEKVLGGYHKGYSVALDYWTKFRDGLDLLRSKKGMTIILIAHSELRKFDSPETEPFHQFSLSIHEKAAAFWRYWADCVLFARFREYDRQATDKSGRTKAIKGGGEDRVLYCENRAAFMAKNRFDLPAELELDYETFTEAMRAGMQDREPKATKKKTTTKKKEK